jgi:hypothetical protein
VKVQRRREEGKIEEARVCLGTSDGFKGGERRRRRGAVVELGGGG